jgi:carotenoid cleavage dioxygenase-like enzyme
VGTLGRMATATPSPPFYARGNFRPVLEETTAFDLPVRGAIPDVLDGLYVRNGPNPRSGTPGHWFFGDGMLHGVHLSGGRARWYRNRWVRTPMLESGGSETPGPPDLRGGPANTHVVYHGGRLFALVEVSFPYEVTPELDTVGPFDFGGRLTTAMTAHPKICPVTGEMHFFGYGFAPPLLTYHVASPDGELVHSTEVEVPGPTMMHDFALTRSQVVFMDLPVVFDLDLALRNTMPYRWSDDYGARLGVMPRGGQGSQVRWFEIEPCYVFHVLNAYDGPDGTVVVDVVRYRELWRRVDDFSTLGFLYRWTIDASRGTVSETQLDDRPVEFPRVDERVLGLAHRHGYAVSYPSGRGDEPVPEAVVAFDLATGQVAEQGFSGAKVPSEAVFVPAPDGSADDEGFLVCFVHDRAEDRSQLAVMEATELQAPPVGLVELPSRVPYGFHGSWVPGVG